MTSRQSRKQAGFTLIEILVTTAIIGILVGIVLGVSGVATRKSDESKARAEMQKIGNAIEQYRLANGTVPERLSDLTAANSGVSGEFREIKLQDPWGRDFEYAKTSKYGFTLYSRGIKKDDASDDIASGSY